VDMIELYHYSRSPDMVWIRRISFNDVIASDKRFLKGSNLTSIRRSRAGVSPVISTTIILAITVALGLSLWSSVASQANTSAESFTSAVTDYVNYVNERYVPVNMVLGHDDPKINACSNDSKCVILWIYNYSEKGVKIDQVRFGTSASDQTTVSDFDIRLPDGTISDNKILQLNKLGSVTMQLSDDVMSHPFTHDGQMYYITVISSEGTSQVYYQADK